MADPNPFPKADYGRNINSPDVLIIGAGISGMPRTTRTYYVVFVLGWYDVG